MHALSIPYRPADHSASLSAVATSSFNQASRCSEELTRPCQTDRHCSILTRSGSSSILSTLFVRSTGSKRNGSPSVNSKARHVARAWISRFRFVRVSSIHRVCVPRFCNASWIALAASFLDPEPSGFPRIRLKNRSRNATVHLIGRPRLKEK